MRVLTLVLMAAIAAVFFVLLPNPTTDDATQPNAQCSFNDLGGITEQLGDDPGQCIQDLVTGLGQGEGTWRSGALVYNAGAWTTAYEPTLSTATEYDAQSISEAATTPWTFRVLNADREVYSASFTTGEYAALRFDYKDLPGKDTVQVLRGGATHYEAVY